MDADEAESGGAGIGDDWVPAIRAIDPELLPELVRDRRYGEVVGCPESSRVEFKREGYALQHDVKKAELAKDVSAMANAQGGYIIIGVKTVRPSTAVEDIAKIVRPIPEHQIDVVQYRGVIRDWCYPSIQGVSVEWCTAGDDGDDAHRGVLVINVPPQPDNDRLVMQVWAVDDKSDKKFDAFSVFIRDGSDNRRLRPGEVHRLISEGYRRRNDPPAPADFGAPAADPVERAKELGDRIEAYMGWTDATTLLLGALPASAEVQLPEGFYAASGLYGAMHHPTKLRDAGFNLTWDEQPTREGQALVVNAGRERALWLEPDGSFAAGANADSDFLSWAFNRATSPETPGTPINLVVLTEYVYLFTHFVHEHLIPVFGSYTYVPALRGARSRSATITLPRGLPRDLPWGGGREALYDDPATPVANSEDAAVDALQVLRCIYDFFGAEHSQIRFVDDGRIVPSWGA